MSEPFFPDVDRIPYQGPDGEQPLAYRYYDAERVVLGKRSLVLERSLEPRPRSGRQEMLENLLNRVC